MPKPSTLAPPPPSQTETTDKKWKRDKKGGKGSSEEGEIHEEAPPEQSKATKVSRTQQRRGGETSDMILERRSRTPNWNLPLMLDRAPLPTNSSIHNFDNERSGYIANSVKQALLLPRDMAELWNLKKH